MTRTRRWRYQDADVLARVESLRRDDRVYLPGPRAPGGAGRVVAHVELHGADPAVPGRPGLPARVVVSYFTGERARPLDHARGDEPGELIVQELRWLEVGTRIRCRRVERADVA